MQKPLHGCMSRITSYISDNINARRTQHGNAFAIDPRIRVLVRYDNTPDTCFNQCGSTWRSLSMMGARFKRNIGCASTRPLSRHGKSHCFGVWPTCPCGVSHPSKLT
jgi:hypothetical protein